MRKKHIFIIIILLLGYGAFLFLERQYSSSGNAPVIEVPDSVLTLSVKDKEKTLLKNVKASDKEDGDLSKNVYIENISSFENGQIRTVTYAVIDSDDNIARATRKIQYEDYQKPEISLTRALCMEYIESNDSLKDYVEASSSVDGDITAKISVDRTEYTEDECYVTYSVTDSCGVKTTLKTAVTFLNDKSDIDIILTDYLIRVKKGEEIDPRDYIDEIDVMGMDYSYLKNDVSISGNYDPSAEGTYEYIYRLKMNGDTGITKLVVIAEEDEDEQK